MPSNAIKCHKIERTIVRVDASQEHRKWRDTWNKANIIDTLRYTL